MSDPGTSSKDALQQLLDGLQTFIREHLALARVEVKEDLRGLARDLAVGAAGVPALAAGYLLSMIAIGYLLAIWLPQWAAFAIVAAANLGAGGLLTWSGARRVMSNRVELTRTASEIRRDREWLASMTQGPRRADTPVATPRTASLTQPGAQPGDAPPGFGEGTHA
ncbi:MAG TPA: phage holin family protein [Myxococcales bacterium]|nr:phage holin family protein [Myxococcales bacterium]